MTSPVSHDGDQQQSAFDHAPVQLQRPPAIPIPKFRSASNLLSQGSNTLAADVPAPRARMSMDASTEAYDSLTRSPILSAERDTGLRRIRQHPLRLPSSPNLQALTSPPSLSDSNTASRKASLALLTGPSSPTLPFSEDLARFPSESLHSFSFAHQSSDSLHNRQHVLKRSIEFMRDKLGWAASSPRIASAQARLTGDEELLSMIELLQKANMMSVENFDAAGLGIHDVHGGLGPLTGPAHMANENVFDHSFVPDVSERSMSPVGMDSQESSVQLPEESGLPSPRSASPVSLEPHMSAASTSNSASHQLPGIARISTPDANDMPGLNSVRPQKHSLKRTYTDVAGLSLQHKLTEAMAKPYHAGDTGSGISPPNVPTVQQPPVRSSTFAERAPHGHRSQQAQAIFTTEAEAPWTITAANDLACLIFGVTRAEVRKLGIMEVIQESRREWLEDKLRNPELGSATRPRPQPSQTASPNSSLANMGNGAKARSLSKPPGRNDYPSRRRKTENGVMTPPRSGGLNHNNNKSRGVLLCGDVVPIKKMNGETGSASLWVKEKSSNLIWVLEEIAEDVAYITVDEIGSVVRGSGNVEAIWGMERLRRGMDVQKIIPAFPKVAGTNTGALDYDVVANLRRFTARTSNSISIPITVDQVPNESVFRVSSFPHIAGIMVLNPATMRVSSSNNVFSGALFGHHNPDGMLITELIPSFDKILNVMTDEDDLALVDGIVIPEHSFRRARSLLALREGSTDAAAIFLRPSGLPAQHRDGAEIMIDVQMRVVKSDRDPIYKEQVIEEEEDAPTFGSEVVYALWITYSRQLHAVNHGIGPVTQLVSRPGTPPRQPRPGTGVDGSVPTPMAVLSESGEEELRTKLLSEQLEHAQAAQGTESPTGKEPFEHPSPDMVEAGCEVIKKKKIAEFAILEEMGQGAYGQVKLARYKASEAEKMVIKYVTKRRILVDTWHRDRRLGTVPLEIHVLDYLRREGMQHPNIVEMADFFEDDTNYYIEMLPHGLPGMDLFDYIELRVTMEERECRKIFRQVAEAIRHLHVNAKVVHRDIKDENVILDGEGRVKLVDFGSAAYIKSGPFDVFVGTIDYAAPEVLRGGSYRGQEQDVWALGILLYTIVYKENPFYSIDEIMDHDLRVPYVMSEDCIDLIRKMLVRDVEKRIGIQAVMEHPWCTVVEEEVT